MSETLTCAEGHEWEWVMRRGPQPQRCPEHARLRRYARTRAWRKRNPEHISEYSRKYQKDHADECKAWRLEYYDRHRERLRLEAVQRYWDDPDKHREKSRRSYAANAEKYASYREANRDRHREMKARWLATPEGRATDAASRAARRARERAASASAGLSWRTLYAASRDCYLCGVACDPEDKAPVQRPGGVTAWRLGATYPTLDHMVPLARGGTHTPNNVALACHSCNSRKSDRPLMAVPQGRRTDPV